MSRNAIFTLRVTGWLLVARYNFRYEVETLVAKKHQAHDVLANRRASIPVNLNRLTIASSTTSSLNRGSVESNRETEPVL